MGQHRIELGQARERKSVCVEEQGVQKHGYEAWKIASCTRLASALQGQPKIRTLRNCLRLGPTPPPQKMVNR
jgi:hypothetical protein